jgi:hypothetical protein
VGREHNLAKTMVAMAYEKNFPVRQWMLAWPVVTRLMGLGGLLFELGFLPALLHPRTRWVWPVGLTGAQRRVIACLVAAVAVVSIVGVTDAWPIAAYPGFENLRAAEVTAYVGDGRPLAELSAVEGVRSQRAKHLISGAIRTGR